MYRLIDKNGIQQFTPHFNLEEIMRDCDEMNRVSVQKIPVYAADGTIATDADGNQVFRTVITNRFRVEQVNIVHGPADEVAAAAQSRATAQSARQLALNSQIQTVVQAEIAKAQASPPPAK